MALNENTDIYLVEPTRDFDIVLSSKARLARNLTDFSFPSTLKKQEQTKLTQIILHAIKTLPEEFDILSLEEIEPVLLKKLQENNLLETEYYYQSENPVIINSNQLVTAKICDGDHLRLSAVYPGQALSYVYHKIDMIDSSLEEKLHYASSLEWGYHCSSVKNLGTGLKVSLFLHLPALVISSALESITNNAINEGITIKSLYRDEKGNLGNIFQISNQLAYGFNEKEIIENMLNTINPIINQERKARLELLNHNKIELEDRIFRAYGILKHSRMITFKEAIEHLSFLRMGVCQGVIDNITLESITHLFFLLKDAHIKKLIRKFDAIEKDEKFINKIRAKMIRDIL